jgi:signal transduction histidine kinase/DNA-binding response OmpR family regulator
VRPPILVVDDNPNNLRSMEAVLRSLDAEIVLAASGMDALRELLRRDFAVVLLDVQMPEIDGYETARLIRSRDRSRDTPIIFVTAHHRNEKSVLQAYALGAVDFLFKPIAPEILTSKVVVFLDLHQKTLETQRQAELLRTAQARELQRALEEQRNLYERERLREEAERERRLKEALAEKAAELSSLVDETERAKAALQRSFSRLELLSNTAHEFLFASGRDSWALLNRRVSGRFGLDRLALLCATSDPGHAEVILHRGLGDLEVPRVLPRAGAVEMAFQRGIRLSLDPPTAIPEMAALGLRSGAVLPLLTGDETKAVVILATDEAIPLGEDDLAALQILCDQAHTADERNRLITELREADRRKDEFLAMLAHELRNPLAPICNALETFRLRWGEDADPPLRRAIDAAERQARHMTRLIDDLLDVSRITRGKVELRRERVALSALVEHAVHATETLFRQRHHTLEVVLPDGEVVVDADPSRLAQVLGNLLQNAAKYTAPGGKVWLRGRVEVEERELVLEIADNGIGIRPEMLASIFEMFVQEEPRADRAPGGLGLGLTLVRSLVTLHGGRVSAHSEGLGRGSTFTVRLPLPEPIAEATPIARAVRRAAVASTEDRPLEIVIVEDNPDIRTTTRDLLELLGHHVLEAGDGDSGVELVRERHPNVVLVDIGLPGADGYAVARRIREDHNGGSPRLVALTGYGSAEDRSRALDAGFDAHLVKPVTVEQLQTLFHQFFDPAS